MERRYAPYPKWFGAAFARLDCAAEIGPLLAGALRAEGRREREAGIAGAALRAAELHLRLGHPGALQPRLLTFSDPPPPGRSAALERRRPRARLRGDQRRRPRRRDPGRDRRAGDPRPAPVGAVDQFSDSTDLLEWPRLTLAAAAAVNLDRNARAGPPGEVTPPPKGAPAAGSRR